MTKKRDKVRKASRIASETRKQTLHRQEQNRTRLSCAEDSALQCCSFCVDVLAADLPKMFTHSSECRPEDPTN